MSVKETGRGLNLCSPLKFAPKSVYIVYFGRGWSLWSGLKSGRSLRFVLERGGACGSFWRVGVACGMWFVLENGGGACGSFWKEGGISVCSQK